MAELPVSNSVSDTIMFLLNISPKSIEELCALVYKMPMNDFRRQSLVKAVSRLRCEHNQRIYFDHSSKKYFLVIN